MRRWILCLTLLLCADMALAQAAFQFTAPNLRAPDDPEVSETVPMARGAKVLLLGSIVDDASNSISNYNGTESQVIWGGFAARLR